MIQLTARITGRGCCNERRGDDLLSYFATVRGDVFTRSTRGRREITVQLLHVNLFSLLVS